MQENQDLFYEYLKAYVEVQAFSGKLASARNELARRAKALCEAYGAAANGTPIVVNSPIGIVALTLDENPWDYPNLRFVEYFADEAVKLQFLQQIQDVEANIPKNIHDMTFEELKVVADEEHIGYDETTTRDMLLHAIKSLNSY